MVWLLNLFMTPKFIFLVPAIFVNLILLYLFAYSMLPFTYLIVSQTKMSQTELWITLLHFSKIYFSTSVHFKKKDFIYSLIEGEGREKERERNIEVREKYQSVASRMCPNYNPGMCPEQEMKPATFRFVEWHPTN